MSYDVVEMLRDYVECSGNRGKEIPNDETQLQDWQKQTCQKLAQLIGFQDWFSDQPHPEVLENVDCGNYVRFKLVINTIRGKQMPFYVLKPKGAVGRLPVVMALHGHGYGVKAIVGLDEHGNPTDEPDYHKNFAIELVRRGFLVACPEIISFGEQVPDQSSAELAEGAALGSPCHSTSSWAMMVGGSVIGLRVLENRCLIDYLATRDDADIDRLGMMGISGGGMLTFYSTALDQRVKACVISGYYCSWHKSILGMNHCICNFVPGVLTLGDLPELGALLWPRPVVVEAGSHDPIFPIAAVRQAVEQLQQLYTKMGTHGIVQLDEFDADHQISGAVSYDFLTDELSKH